jgi:hypothetical protein
MAEELLFCLSGGGGVGEPLVGYDSGQLWLWLRRTQGLCFHFVQNPWGQQPSDRRGKGGMSEEKQRHVTECKNMKTEEMVLSDMRHQQRGQWQLLAAFGKHQLSPDARSTVAEFLAAR